jgi:hypothetical protein
MRLTQELLEKTFNHFNDLIFANEIKPRPTIKVYSSKVNAGYFIGEPDEDNNPTMVIKISDRYNKTYEQFCETMLHEMVHCFQYIKHMPVDHDKAFNLMAKVIKKELGIDIR